MNQELIAQLQSLTKVCLLQQDQLSILIRVSEKLANKVAALQTDVLELQGKEK